MTDVESMLIYLFHLGLPMKAFYRSSILFLRFLYYYTSTVRATLTQFIFLKVLRKRNSPMTHHRTDSAEVPARSLSEYGSFQGCDPADYSRGFCFPLIFFLSQNSIFSNTPVAIKSS